MARPCSICKHDQRKAIDLALAAKKSAGSVARSFAVSEDALDRHRRSHLRPGLVRAAASREDVSYRGVIDRMVELTGRTIALLDKAEASEAKLADQARLIREARENEIALARLTGILREGSTTIDARTQTITVLSTMTEGELRALASLGQPKAIAGGETIEGAFTTVGSGAQDA